MASFRCTLAKFPQPSFLKVLTNTNVPRVAASTLRYRHFSSHKDVPQQSPSHCLGGSVTPSHALCAPLINSKRSCASRSGNQDQDLMNCPRIVWPSFFLTVKNWIQATFIIKPYLDMGYNQKEFLNGAKQALTYVSALVARGDFKSLEGLVASPTISEVQRNYSLFTEEQRQKLSVELTDIYFCFLYQIGIIMDDRNDQRFVEATVVYHYMPGLERIRQSPSLPDETMEQVRSRVHVANYRFIREYTKGVQGDWTINQLNHFKLGPP
ncbi:unnamed protein product [Ixodes persulcatus]